MARKKKFRPKSALKDSNQESDEMSNSGNDLNDMNDEINVFHTNKDKELLNKSALSHGLDSEEDDNESEEEIMPFGEDSSDSDQQMDGLNRFAVELKKDEMASDLEDSEEDLPDSNAWGNQKNVFYNTDYVDNDFRKYKQKDEDLAQFEEEEALQIQRRLLLSINESDVGIDLLVGDIEPKTAFNDMNGEDIEEDEERVETNLSNLTKREKLEILRKESPELEAIINDFKTGSTEIKDRLLPVMAIIKDKEVFNLSSIKYIETRFQLLINYCVNICFYMTLKAKRVSVKEHPVIQQILSFKKLLSELNAINESTNGSIDKDIDLILEKSKSGQEISFFKKRTKEQKTDKNEKIVKKVKFADDLDGNELQTNQELEDFESEEMSKRGITNEMQKNKGLTPKRKKELKNPRVKHRMKFRKAKIRRKGQVREPRKELHRYGGELSGIKSGVIKSVKF